MYYHWKRTTWCGECYARQQHPSNAKISSWIEIQSTVRRNTLSDFEWDFQFFSFFFFAGKSKYILGSATTTKKKITNIVWKCLCVSGIRNPRMNQIIILWQELRVTYVKKYKFQTTNYADYRIRSTRHKIEKEKRKKRTEKPKRTKLKEIDWRTYVRHHKCCVLRYK